MDRLTVPEASLSTPAHLAALLDAFAIGRCGNVVRAKGCLPCAGQWVRFDYVGGIWEFIGAQPAASPSFVVIGRDLELELIGRLMPGAHLHFHEAQGGELAGGHDEHDHRHAAVA